VHLSLMANPSHLEAVNTCVLGKTRAKQLLSVSRTCRQHCLGRAAKPSAGQLRLTPRRRPPRPDFKS
jgi:2-oxoglutarate dehydrogenase complex dehydrogenase (E1) component-like enzyme